MRTRPLINTLADLTGREIINMYYNDEIPPKYDEDKVIDTAIKRIAGDLPNDLYDAINTHAALDDYLNQLDQLIKRDTPAKLEHPPNYRTATQRLAEIGMSIWDFI